MSANKSWDIRPNTRRVVRAPDPVIPRRGSPAAPGPRLKERRRRIRRIGLIVFVVLLVVALGTSVYVLWRPALRIQNISIEGFDAPTLEPIIKTALSGTYVYLFPRDSIVLFPKQAIRDDILNAYPDISAVSVSRSGFTAITVKTIERVSAFDWCGSIPDSSAPCYQADAEGLVFAEAINTIPEDGASTTPSGVLRIYAPLVEASGTPDSPIRAHVANADRLPSVLRFERAMTQLGADVVSLQLRDDEADLYVRSGTRITYVVGNEEGAAQLAATTFPQLNLDDGSIIYVDLRFDGKVYLKKKGE
jgi:hypothetical protein